MTRADVVLVLLLAQAATPAPIRLGDAAGRLTDSDVAAIVNAVASLGSGPWLVAAGDGWANRGSRGTRSVVAYLPPQTTTADLRRGMGALILRAPAQDGWTMESTFNWAQVKIADRDFTDIRSDTDVNRPFMLRGRFNTSEIVNIARFLRTSPRSPSVNDGPWSSVRGDRPILSISRHTETFDAVLQVEARTGQKVTLRSDATGWVVVSIAPVVWD